MPRSEEQYKVIREKSKRIIMETALELFAANGFHSTTISRIAKKAGIATGLVYNYFNSKEELMDEILRSSFEEFGHLIHDSAMNGSGENNLGSIINTFFNALKGNKNLWRLAIAVQLQPGVTKVATNSTSHFFAHIDDFLERYFISKGEADPKKKAKVLGDLIHCVALTYIVTEDESLLGELISEIITKHT